MVSLPDGGYFSAAPLGVKPPKRTSADGDARVCRTRISARDLLDGLGERGREHERLPARGRRQVVLLDDASYLRLKTHVEHPIGFVEHQEAAVRQADLQASGGRGSSVEARACNHVDSEQSRGQRAVTWIASSHVGSERTVR